MNNFVNDEVIKNRYSICCSCEKFLEFTKECSENKEFLDKYIYIKESVCPINKWV